MTIIKPKLYRPSNVIEAKSFEEIYCDSCILGAIDGGCETLQASRLFKVDDERYPEELIYENSDTPTCTRYRELK